MAYKYLQSESQKYTSRILSSCNMKITNIVGCTGQYGLHELSHIQQPTTSQITTGTYGNIDELNANDKESKHTSLSDIKQNNEKHILSGVSNDSYLSLSDMKKQVKKAAMKKAAIKLKEEERIKKEEDKIKCIIDTNAQLYTEQFREISDRIGQNITGKLIELFYNSITVTAGVLNLKPGTSSHPCIHYFASELSTIINNEIKFIGSECEYWNINVLHNIAYDRIRINIYSYVTKAVTEYLQSKEFNVEVKYGVLNDNADENIKNIKRDTQDAIKEYVRTNKIDDMIDYDTFILPEETVRNIKLRNEPKLIFRVLVYECTKQKHVDNKTIKHRRILSPTI
jgi:hypothetical protein